MIFWKLILMRIFMFLVYRYHVVQEFNKGVYDYIIATDESGAHGEHDEEDQDEDEENGEESDKEEKSEECQS
jgi:ATP-dependent RNA helicase DDX56/DBP9